MDYATAKKKGIIKSGNIAAFKQAETLLEKWIEFWTGKYYHVGMFYVDPVTDEVYLYEADFPGIKCDKFDESWLPIDVIETDIDFTKDVKRYADFLINRRYSWINFFLVCVDLNFDIFGFICSTLVGTILAVAHERFKTQGLTPSRLIKDLSNKKCKIYSVE